MSIAADTSLLDGFVPVRSPAPPKAHGSPSRDAEHHAPRLPPRPAGASGGELPEPATAPETVAPPADSPRDGELPRADKPLHRVGEARWQEGISRRTVARRMGLTVRQIQDQEDPAADLPLSVLYQWQKALNVPAGELLVDHGADLSPTVAARARLLKVMKTAVTILQRSKQPVVRQLAQLVVDQIVEAMPELKDVPPWPSVGKRRLSSDLGVAAQRSISPSILPGLE